MALTFRHYIFQDDGTLKRVPRRVYEALPFGNDAIPEYANTRQRHAEVFVENEDRKPVRILDVIGTFWDFDEEGRIDDGLRKTSSEWMDVAFGDVGRKGKENGPVVDLVPELKKRDLHKRHRWTITKDELDLIAADLWPGFNGPAPEITSVKGKAPKKPPLTTEARWALAEIEKNVSAIKHRLDMLSERALKGLAFEAVRTSMWDDEIFWRAVSEEAKRRQAIRAAHRTGRGDWYAVLERAREDNERPYLWQQVSVAHAKGANREKAAEAGRRLLVEKVDWLGAGTELSITLRSALEWQPEDEGP